VLGVAKRAFSLTYFEGKSQYPLTYLLPRFTIQFLTTTPEKTMSLIERINLINRQYLIDANKNQPFHHRGRALADFNRSRALVKRVGGAA